METSEFDMRRKSRNKRVIIMGDGTSVEKAKKKGRIFNARVLKYKWIVDSIFFKEIVSRNSGGRRKKEEVEPIRKYKDFDNYDLCVEGDSDGEDSY